MNVHNGKPAKKRAKKDASRDEGPVDRNQQSTADTRFNGRQAFDDASAGSHASARLEGNSSRIDVNANPHMELSNLSGTGGTGGAGGSGGLIGGTGGNGAGTAISVNFVFHFPR
ncbi:hypothetical protein MSAN_01827900 [Mycena sanguinolenta]|uniref:Uncharacterized protein n=1 Tax=Mycena sanguinolenta TaxID=230812 RepID=A0A8H6XQA5_9AGAR|nr:hypothetical protein MSAN_01827900 [Mycena sanguinolenta]